MSLRSRRALALYAALLLSFQRAAQASPRPIPTHECRTSQNEVDFRTDYNEFVSEILDQLRQGPIMPDLLDYSSLEVALPCTRQNDGLWLEFGVYTGRTIKLMARYRTATRGGGVVYGFDSFKGLPENWTNTGTLNPDKYTKRGSFSLGGKPPFPETEHIKWVQGWYNETLPPFLAGRPGWSLSLLHIDCDLYSSTTAVFDALRPLIQPGLVIVFDELFNYPEFLEGELKALWELLSARPDLSLEVVGTSTRNINSASDYRPGQLGWLRTQLGRYQSCAVRLTASKRPQRRRQLRLP